LELDNPLIDPKYRKVWKIIGNGLGVLGLSVWLFHFFVWYQYDGTRPRRPDASTGNVFPQNTHGHVVYLTKAEDARITRLTIIAFGLFACSGAVYYFGLGERFRKPKIWEKKQF
jgi:hypothetical protein